MMNVGLLSWCGIKIILFLKAFTEGQRKEWGKGVEIFKRITSCNRIPHNEWHALRHI